MDSTLPESTARFLPPLGLTEVAFESGTFESEVCDSVFVNKVIQLHV